MKFTSWPLLSFFIIHFPQNPRKLILDAKFGVASTTWQEELHRLIYSVSLNCDKDTQAYSVAYTLWCFTNGTSFISDWVGHRKKNQLFHHVSEIFLIICQEWEVENRSGSRRKKSLSCFLAFFGFFSETRSVINYSVLRWSPYDILLQFTDMWPVCLHVLEVLSCQVKAIWVPIDLILSPYALAQKSQ